MTETVFNPGSKKAIKAGCTCPVIDNNYGNGAFTFNKQAQFWYNSDCPLHKNVEILYTTDYEDLNE